MRQYRIVQLLPELAGLPEDSLRWLQEMFDAMLGLAKEAQRADPGELEHYAKHTSLAMFGFLSDSEPIDGEPWSVRRVRAPGNVTSHDVDVALMPMAELQALGFFEDVFAAQDSDGVIWLHGTYTGQAKDVIKGGLSKGGSPFDAGGSEN